MNGYFSDNKNDKGIQTIDWESVRERIAAAEAALAGLDGGASAPEVLHQVWARRAAQLAEAPQQEEEGAQIELVLVRLGRELYGLDVQHVLDIRPLEQLTLVPRVPDWVAGVVNLRGRIYSVVDLRRFFGLANVNGNRKDPDQRRFGFDQSGETRFLVVVETPEMELALLVEEVLTVEALPERRIQEAAGMVRGLRPEHVRGVAEYGGTETKSSNGNGSMLVVLNLPALLADERLIIHEEIV